MPPPLPQALLFDTFGTLVDWHGGIVATGKAISSKLDWSQFARAWHHAYVSRTGAARVASPALADLLQRALEDLLEDFRLEDLSPEDRTRLVRAWHVLEAWPDVATGLGELQRASFIAPLSNADATMLVEISRRNRLSWDLVLPSELFGAYKPDARVYLGAARLLRCRPEQLAVVAAHPEELTVVKSLGFRTVYVERPDEFGTGRALEPARPEDIDVRVQSLTELARHVWC